LAEQARRRAMLDKPGIERERLNQAFLRRSHGGDGSLHLGIDEAPKLFRPLSHVLCNASMAMEGNGEPAPAPWIRPALAVNPEPAGSPFRSGLQRGGDLAHGSLNCSHRVVTRLGSSNV
jgi:hypothetical protein